MKREMIEVGRPVPRCDAQAKVTGEERYATDYYPEHLLWAGVKRAGTPHGRIRKIDVSSVRGLPGIAAILTAKDAPGTNHQGIVHKDQPVLADEKVRHRGDPGALVLAEDKETLQMALALIRMDIDPLPAVFDPEEALKPGRPPVHG